MTGRQEVDLGNIAPAEVAAGQRVNEIEETAAHKALRESLEAQRYEAAKMRQWFETQLRGTLQPGTPWEFVTQYADWYAREALVNGHLERMGWR